VAQDVEPLGRIRARDRRRILSRVDVGDNPRASFGQIDLAVRPESMNTCPEGGQKIRKSPKKTMMACPESGQP
jgi:hypothetical protein